MVSFIGGGNRKIRRQPPTCRKLTKLYYIILYTSAWAGGELITSVVTGTDCIGSCKSNYHTITATTVPKKSNPTCFNLVQNRHCTILSSALREKKRPPVSHRHTSLLKVRLKSSFLPFAVLPIPCFPRSWLIAGFLNMINTLDATSGAWTTCTPVAHDFIRFF